MTLVVKAMLMIVVILPPGTFRSLDAWIHRARSRNHESIVSTADQRQFVAVPASDSDPARYRYWSDFVFLDDECEDDEDATHARKFRVETARHFQISAKDCLTIGIARLRQSVVSLLDAHAGPRGLLLAKRELLL